MVVIIIIMVIMMNIRAQITWRNDDDSIEEALLGLIELNLLNLPGKLFQPVEERIRMLWKSPPGEEIGYVAVVSRVKPVEGRGQYPARRLGQPQQ